MLIFYLYTRGESSDIKMFQKINRAGIHVVYSFLGYSLEINNRNKLPQKEQYILASNHLSKLDVPTLMLASGRDISFIMKKKYAEGFFGKIWQIYRPIILENGFIKYPLEQSLKQGKIIGIFPEGKRGEEEVIGEFKRGLSKLADVFNLPVVPARIRGTKTVWPKGQALPDWGRYHICVNFGDALEPKYASEEKVRETILNL